MEKELPDGWKITNLEYICNLVTDGTHDKTPLVDKKIGVPLITSKDLTEDGISFENVIYITKEQHQQIIRRSKPEKGDILYSKIGTIGKPTIVDVDIEFSIKNVALFKLKEDIIFSKYLRYYLKWEHVHNSLLKRADGGNQKFIPINALKKIEIILPPLETQQKIVAVLEKAEETKKLRAQADELTQQLLQSVFLEMFDGSHANDWPVTIVEEVVHPNKGSMRTGPFGSQLLHSEFVEEGIAVLGIDNAVKNNFEWGKRRFISESKYEELKRYTVYPGDVVITIMGTCGRCAIVPDDIPLSINTKHLCCITLNQEKCLPIYLHGYFLQHPISRQYLLSKANGAIMDGLNMKIIKDMPIIIPPIELQKKYGAIVQKIKETKQAQQQSSLEINTLFDALMQKAFNGNLYSF
ncbi:Type I restriction-modification system, specificity subunit S [Methanosarcina sp. MTP4]|uniref:restriction endonuclease subunit S n=1 Tax=Methanosarcina sp. MTP4 TaxID=1434100 RepID=UPI000615C76C|nr:restriction endonuclease subunit S [Methanosarcina sp. MTP4]AKB24773.1 Type I restriction-modification system, specificity subunit S [Methanosarcina sp. MTP4]